jgi:hypothetical protein
VETARRGATTAPIGGEGHGAPGGGARMRRRGAARAAPWVAVSSVVGMDELATKASWGECSGGRLLLDGAGGGDGLSEGREWNGGGRREMGVRAAGGDCDDRAMPTEHGLWEAEAREGPAQMASNIGMSIPINMSSTGPEIQLRSH